VAGVFAFVEANLALFCAAKLALYQAD